MTYNLDTIIQEFTNTFIEAFGEKSVEKCLGVILNYKDQLYLAEGEKLPMSKEKYNKNMVAPTAQFLEEAEPYIDKQNAFKDSLLLPSNIAEVNTGKFEMSNDYFQVIDTISIYMNTYLVDHINYQVHFRINNTMLIDGKIKITNWGYVSYGVGKWDTIKEQNNPYPKLEDNEKLKKLVVDLKEEYKNYVRQWKWHIHEGDLELDKFDVNVNLIVTGNLTLKEPLVEIEQELMVFGRTTLNSLFAEQDNSLLFLGGIEFKVGVFIISSGPYLVFNQPNGPFFYSNSESFEIEHTHNIKSFIDIEYANFKGDAKNHLIEKYLIKTEDGYYDLNNANYEKMKEAIRKGDTIFR